MSDRLPTGLVVSALLRRVHDAGGAATIVARGDPDAGGVLILTVERGQAGRCLEPAIGPDGRRVLAESGPTDADSDEVDAWLARRRHNDPDLWIVELDVADSERLAAESLLND